MTITYQSGRRLQGLSTDKSITPSLADSGISKTSCKAYWKLDESSGTLVNYATVANGFADGLGSSADSTTVANLTYAQTGKVGSAVSFNGTTSSSKIELGISLSQYNFLHNTSALFTLNIWYKKTAIDTNFRTIFANHYGAGAQTGARFAFNGTNGININIRNGSTEIVLDTTSGFIPANTDWHMLTITYDQSLASNNMGVYIDGVLHHTINKTGNTPSNSNASQTSMLGDDQGGDGNMYGLLDEVSIFNRVLTQAEITTLYSGIDKLQTQSRFEETDTQTIYYLVTDANPAFSDDFSGADNWVDNDSTKIGVNTTTDVLDFNMVRDNTNDSSSYDLTSTNDTAWVLRFKISFSAISGGSANGNGLWIGLSDTTTGATSSKDFIGVQFIMDNTNSVFCNDVDGATLVVADGDGTFTWTPSLNTPYYIEIIRLTSTSYQVKIFSDSTFSTQVGTTLSGTCNSTIQSLRYIQLLNRIDASGGRNFTGTVDDVKFYNGVSSLPAWRAQQ